MRRLHDRSQRPRDGTVHRRMGKLRDTVSVSGKRADSMYVSISRRTSTLLHTLPITAGLTSLAPGSRLFP